MARSGVFSGERKVMCKNYEEVVSVRGFGCSISFF